MYEEKKIFYMQLISEKPNIAVESKFYVLTKLPMQVVRNEFQDADVTFLRKQETNSKEMAQYVKEHLDSLYIRERLNNLRSGE